MKDSIVHPGVLEPFSDGRGALPTPSETQSQECNPICLRLDFFTDMTRVSARVIRLGVAVMDDGAWRYGWWRTFLQPEELALCNLETWPELRDPDQLCQRILNDLNRDGWPHTYWAAPYSALHWTADYGDVE